MDQAGRLVGAAFADPTVMRPYVIVSLLTGARTEELRALTWSHVDLDADPPTMSQWRSVRATGDTKTRKSRRTLELPALRVEVLRAHRVAQRQTRVAAAERFCRPRPGVQHRPGQPAGRGQRAARVSPGLPRRLGWMRRRGLRESSGTVVSLLSSTELAIEDISHLVGHANTPVTESVYHKELRPVLARGAGAMDALFPRPVGK